MPQTALSKCRCNHRAVQTSEPTFRQNRRRLQCLLAVRVATAQCQGCAIAVEGAAVCAIELFGQKLRERNDNSIVLVNRRSFHISTSLSLQHKVGQTATLSSTSRIFLQSSFAMLFATSLVSACLFTSHSFAYPWLPSTSTSPPYTLRVAQQARGILTVTFDPSKPANESQKVVDTNTQGGYLPQWLHAYENKIYTMSRTFYPTNASASGGIYAFDRKHSESHQSGAAGGLELLDSTSSDGRGGVYVDVSKDGRTLSAANMYVIAVESSHSMQS